MNTLLVIFMTLVEANDLQQMFYNYHLGNEELMVPSIADERFKLCCIAEIGDNYCTKQLCSISGISSMTPAQFLSYGRQCKGNMRQIWTCAHHMSGQSDCCIKSNLPEECLSYCTGKTLNSRQPNFSCFFYSRKIIQCLRDDLQSYQENDI